MVIKPILTFQDDKHYIRLLPESVSGENGSLVLPANNTYTLEHNVYSEVILTGLTYIEAMLSWVGILSEMIEIHSNDSGNYPFSKDQFASLLNPYLQPDAMVLSETFAKLINKETLLLVK